MTQKERKQVRADVLRVIQDTRRNWYEPPAERADLRRAYARELLCIAEAAVRKAGR